MFVISATLLFIMLDGIVDLLKEHLFVFVCF